MLITAFTADTGINPYAINTFMAQIWVVTIAVTADFINVEHSSFSIATTLLLFRIIAGQAVISDLSDWAASAITTSALYRNVYCSLGKFGDSIPLS